MTDIAVRPARIRTGEAGAAFARRHIGTTGETQGRMLEAIGRSSLADLLGAAVPVAI